MTRYPNTRLRSNRLTRLSSFLVIGFAMTITSGCSDGTDGGQDGGNESNLAPTVMLDGSVTSLAEDVDTSSATLIANIVVNDDGVGTNNLSLSGADADLFEIVGSELRLKAGTVLDFETAPNLSVTVNVDDANIGSGPDDSATLELTIIDVDEGGGVVIDIPPRQPMTSAERIAALDKFVGEIDAILPDIDTSWDQRNPGAEVEAVATRLAELPEVLHVLYDNENDMTATIVMSDGFPVQFINNRLWRPASPATTRLRADAVLKTAKTAHLSASLPGSKKAVAASFDGGEEIAAEIAARLTASGYEVLNLGPSIIDMANYKDLGFLYIDSHGGNFRTVERVFDASGNVTGVQYATDSNGNLISSYTIQSSTTVDGPALQEFESLLDNGQVAIALSQSVVNSGQASFTVTRPSLGITDKFIQQNWTFDNAIVIQHSCYAGASSFNHRLRCQGNGCPPGTTTIDPTPIRQSILNAGASVLMSFSNLTWPTEAAPSMYYFIDRLLGANGEEPQDPPNRAFDWEPVRDGMYALSLMEYFNGPSRNTVVIEGNSGPALLAPSIRFIDVADDISSPSAEMILHGAFGSEMGFVKFGGVNIGITSWTPTTIVARAPYLTAGFGGVHVESSTGIKSNTVPLTEWTGKVIVTVSHHSDTGFLESYAEVNLKFRADVHSYRDKVDETPRERVTKAYLSSAGMSGTIVGAGQQTSPAPGNPVVQYAGGDTVTINSKGVIDLINSYTQPTIGDGESDFAGVVELDPAKDEARLCFWLEGYHDRYVNGELDREPVYLYTPSGFLAFNSSQTLDLFNNNLNCVRMPMGEDFSIPDGESASPNPPTPNGTNYSIQWKDFTTSYPPDAGTSG